ncbi:uncharacterized protein LOC116290649 [Actinia tenebrosa]|uniref:Uncharacterized protein LOC116290649 n=1 Tax=Actinia tenebrosa TaxID=6105 RepID=A0A6P8HD60_ACTTE|nr:uncharacterized protein LOC116290649 [Actinia tenebrosa]
MNSTDETFVEQQKIQSYKRVLAITSACCLSILSIVTTTSNILLLIAIWKDPLKCFKSVAKCFIVGLSMADLITGVTTEPFFTSYYFIRFVQDVDIKGIPLVLYEIGGIISGVALKYSFLVVLALSWSQFTAISWPHKYRRFVTNRNIVIFMILAFLYLVFFTAVQFIGILDPYTFHKIDLVCNSSFLSINLLIVSLLLYRAYRRRAHLHKEFSAKPLTSENETRSKRRKQVERTLDQQFTIVSIYLGAILLLCALPHVLAVYVYLYFAKDLTIQSQLNLLVVLRISDVLLFVKVCADPFIYAWRLPKYRKTLLTLFRIHEQKKNEEETLVGIPLTERMS